MCETRAIRLIKNSILNPETLGNRESGNSRGTRAANATRFARCDRSYWINFYSIGLNATLPRRIGGARAGGYTEGVGMRATYGRTQVSA